MEAQRRLDCAERDQFPFGRQAKAAIEKLLPNARLCLLA
jgi:hypothetical protein